MRTSVKRITIATMLTLSMSLVACGGASNSQTNTASQEEQAAVNAEDLVGNWEFSGVRDAQGAMMSPEEYAAAKSVEAAAVQTSYAFGADGSVVVSNALTGQYGGTWSVSGDQVTMTVDANGTSTTSTMTAAQGEDGRWTMFSTNPEGSVSYLTKVD